MLKAHGSTDEVLAAYQSPLVDVSDGLRSSLPYQLPAFFKEWFVETTTGRKHYSYSRDLCKITFGLQVQETVSHCEVAHDHQGE